jgi:hypothetical protein
MRGKCSGSLPRLPLRSAILSSADLRRAFPRIDRSAHHLQAQAIARAWHSDLAAAKACSSAESLGRSSGNHSSSPCHLSTMIFPAQPCHRASRRRWTELIASEPCEYCRPRPPSKAVIIGDNSMLLRGVRGRQYSNAQNLASEGTSATWSLTDSAPTNDANFRNLARSYERNVAALPQPGKFKPQVFDRELIVIAFHKKKLHQLGAAAKILYARGASSTLVSRARRNSN